ncbi:MAG: hypothetical protein CMO40_01875 [Verrucomicrobiaceae bacterium]|nr:hypothetical protein [Verrucomicrobiaceae bacterium]
MSARASAVKLTKSTKTLLQSWDQVKNYWQDSRQREFEREYIETLPDDISAAIRVIEELDKIITKARRDCED